MLTERMKAQASRNCWPASVWKPVRRYWMRQARSTVTSPTSRRECWRWLSPARSWLLREFSIRAGLFVVEERGTHARKGVPEPTVLFRLVRASGGGRARSGQRQFTPLVGRDEEITLLLRRWERARQGEGQLVLIVGEPGIGKSRLIDEFHARMRDTPHTWVEWNCSQLLRNTPL